MATNLASHRVEDAGASDAVLIARITARDAGALAALYDRHSGLLFGLALRILGDRGEAEEVLQEVFVQVWRRVESYDAGLGSPVAWLVGIARNRAIDHLRATTSRLRAVEAAPLPKSGPSPELHAVDDERRRRVAAALDHLLAEQRILIEQAYFLGFSQSELAKRHGLPLGTVKTRMRSGLMRLREELHVTSTSL